MFQKFNGTANDYMYVYPSPCDHSHDSCQHCYHNCSGCGMSYCCKCGRTWGSWTVTTYPGYTTTNPHIDNTCSAGCCDH